MNLVAFNRLLITFLFLLTADLFAQDIFTEKFCSAAIALTRQQVSYDPSYFRISYPGGDVPADKGVCTDVIIRAYRQLGVDLQQLVHEDMKQNFQRYPRIWGLRSTDRNIDHRRVPNLITFFSRHGKSLAITQAAADYKAGDIVTWNLGRNTPHIGIVIQQKSADGLRNLIVHNIGNGQEIADCLFRFKVTGHFRYEIVN